MKVNDRRKVRYILFDQPAEPLVKQLYFKQNNVFLQSRQPGAPHLCLVFTQKQFSNPLNIKVCLQ